MRRLKFKTWNVKLERFVNSLLIGEIKNADTNNGLVGAIWDSVEEDNESQLYNDCVVCQFTSHFDKNGREIYDGDIVKKFDGVECFVCFDRGCFCLRALVSPDHCCCLKEVEKPHLLEVIGNVFENSDKLTPYAKSFTNG